MLLRRRKLFKFIFYLFYADQAFNIISLLNGVLRPSYMSPPPHYLQLATQIQDSSESGRGNSYGKKVFIAANIINEELIRGSWGDNLLQLVDILGPENVFVSIYENDAGYGTRDALMDLRDKLSCNTSIVAGDHISLSSFPTVIIPTTGEVRTKRLLYLAEVRNRAILPLQSGLSIDAWAASHPTFKSAATTRFDRILFLNDVFFNPVDAVQLLFSTNEGRYDAACAIDFVGKVKFHDTFVVRDTDGYSLGLAFYPWFTPSGSATSRNDVLSQTDAVRVRSCWGGMAAFDAAQNSFAGDTTNSSLSLPGLTFRSITEPFFEEGECCLLFADLEIRRAAIHNMFPASSSVQSQSSDAKPLSAGVFINPYIRVAYSPATWAWLPTARRYERTFQFLQYWRSKTGHWPEHNYRRTHEAGTMVEERVWVRVGSDRIGGRWEIQRRVADAGGWCGQRRMFLMKRDLGEANRDGWGQNWEEVDVPGGKGQ
ncbi:hypothetical protein BU16DRAFT_509484 [Lophium mytilinum]|uniref:Glycosyltransferase family 69 protein n=1 Tax=Lophium mytilinum TaxID=390894 RepID=A0A6A6QVL3_9PEZI|nr:hypothetical protein BU16DRAFT_509484 [Lophium mytilinum]